MEIDFIDGKTMEINFIDEKSMGIIFYQLSLKPGYSSVAVQLRRELEEATHFPYNFEKVE